MSASSASSAATSVAASSPSGARSGSFHAHARLGSARRRPVEAQHLQRRRRTAASRRGFGGRRRDRVAAVRGRRPAARRCARSTSRGQIVDAIAADREAEVLRRDVLELVRLVDDGVAAARNHFAEIALPDGRVRAQQMVVDDDDVGLGGALAHLDDEAVVVARAIGADAVLGRRGDVVPEGQILGQILDLGAVAGLGFRHPALEDADMERLVPRARAQGSSQNASKRWRHR